MPIAIRQGTAADAEIISSLNADVQSLHAQAMPSRFKSPGPDTFPPAKAAALFDDAGNLVFLAEVDSVPVGYAYAEVIHRYETPFTYAFDMIYLHHISVRPKHRERGAGRALIEAVLSAASERGIDLVTLDVWSFNEEARRFFQRRGFKVFNERL